MKAETIIRVFLGCALLASLFVAGERVYRRLPGEGGEEVAGTRGESELTIVMFDGPELNGKANEVAIELYRLDIRSLEQEFATDPRSGKRFDDYLAQRLKVMKPVRAELDQKRQATVRIATGNWWIHARLTLSDGEAIEWRLPVSAISGRQTVELTKENVYERTKRF